MLCRPYWDVDAGNRLNGEEDDSNSEGDEGDDEEEEISYEAIWHGKKCKCGKPVVDFSYPWIITPAGFKLYKKWMAEQANREQDNIGMYIYNDFSGYGIGEVMENMVRTRTRYPIFEFQTWNGLTDGISSCRI